ncbi:unnamed protein product [Mytilus coruscus]|uniref:Transposase Helix-turn-helix domain-containing protein n=1 Tax=Mytilus coruscus TaxID=42192 RepID=A0A6J8C936_MYTCO|nr:unnamed protein product [Mytilus coruscus]
MPGSGPKTYHCCLCRKKTKSTDRIKCTSSEIRKILRRKFMLDASPSDILCNRCRHLYYNAKEKTIATPNVKATRGQFCPKSPTVTNTSETLSSPTSVKLNIKRPKLIVVPPSERLSAFMSNEVLIPGDNHCCPAHIRNGYLTEESFAKIQTTDLTYINRSRILDLLTRIRRYALNSDVKRIDFDGKTLKDEDYINLTGLHSTEFDSQCEYIQDSVRNTPARTMRISLGIFLMKLKSGLPNKVLSTVFNITKSSIRRAISPVRKTLYIHFVPEYLGLQHIYRKEAIKDHTRPLAQSLLGNNTGNQAILVLDGTYIKKVTILALNGGCTCSLHK